MFNPIFRKAKEGKTIELWWTVLGEMSKQFSDADDLQSELAQVTLTCLSIINYHADRSDHNFYLWYKMAQVFPITKNPEYEDRFSNTQRKWTSSFFDPNFPVRSLQSPNVFCPIQQFTVLSVSMKRSCRDAEC